MKKRFLSLLIITLLFLSACAPEAIEVSEVPAPNVQVLDLNERPSYQITEVGTIKADQEIELVAKAAGTIGPFAVKLGDSVFAGQTLAVINYDESNNTAQVNYDNAQLQLANARQTVNETFANSQDSVTRARLRAQTLESSLGRLQRNLAELRTTNRSTEETLKLQLENAEKNAETAEVNYQNVVNQFEQSWKDLLQSATNTLDSVFTHLESEFIAVEDIINPTNAFHFTVSILNSSFGTRDSIQRTETVNAYNDYKGKLDERQADYQAYLPLHDSNIDEALDLGQDASEELRTLISKIRLMLSNSLTSASLSQSTMDAYIAQAGAAESIMLGDVAALNSLEKTLQSFRLDRASQTSTADNNRIIAGNQLTDASNALFKFSTTGKGSVQDLQTQIAQTSNDLLSAQADLDSATRNATIQNSAKTLEVNTFNNQLRLAQKSLDDNKVISTISGSFSELAVDEGDYVTPGTYLAKVIQHDEVKVVFYVSEQVAGSLVSGQPVYFSVQNERQHDYVGSINKISPSADSVNKKIRIEAVVNNTGYHLKPEMFVNLTLDLTDRAFKGTTVYIPMNSIIFSQNDRYVYLLEGGQAVRRSIEIGDVLGSWVEVLSGLSKQDQLIVEGHRNLPSAGGIAVTVVN